MPYQSFIMVRPSAQILSRPDQSSMFLNVCRKHFMVITLLWMYLLAAILPPFEDLNRHFCSFLDECFATFPNSISAH